MTSGPGILVCGSGGFAVEVVSEFDTQVGGVYEHATAFEGLPVYRSIQDASAAGFTEAVIAVGHPSVARRIEGELSAAGFGLSDPLLSPHAVVTGNDVHIGRGSLIMSGTVITNHVRLGRSCVINLNCTIGHGSVLGDFVSVMPLTAISGGVRVGDGCYIGSQAFLMEGISIADNTTLGAMTGVFRDIEVPGSTFVGSPARLLKAPE